MNIQITKLGFPRAETNSSLHSSLRTKDQESKSMKISFPPWHSLAFKRQHVLSPLKSIFKTHVYFLTIHNNLSLLSLRLISQLPGFQLNSMANAN